MLSAIHATMDLLNLNECNRESLNFALTEVPYMKLRAIHYEIAESVTTYEHNRNHRYHLDRQGISVP